jgi:hypothetical protein
VVLDIHGITVKHTLVAEVVDLGQDKMLAMLVLVELAVVVEEVIRIMVLLQLLVQELELLIQVEAVEVVEPMHLVETDQHMLLAVQELQF